MVIILDIVTSSTKKTRFINIKSQVRAQPRQPTDCKALGLAALQSLFCDYNDPL